MYVLVAREKSRFETKLKKNQETGAKVQVFHLEIETNVIRDFVAAGARGSCYQFPAAGFADAAELYRFRGVL